MGHTRKCAVPTCGYRNSRYSEKRSMFQCPKDEEKARRWIERIPGLNNLTPYQYVCEAHFESRFIRKYCEDRNNIMRARLKVNAVPSIFSDIPDHMLSGYFDNSNNTTVMSTLVHNAVNPNINDNMSPNTSGIIDGLGNHVSAGFSNENISRNHQVPSRVLNNNVVGNHKVQSKFPNASVKRHQIQIVESSLRDIVKDLSASEQLLLDIKKEMLEELPGVKNEDYSDSVKNETDVEITEPTVYETVENNITYYTTKLPESWRIVQLPIGTDEVFVFSKECTINDNQALVVIYEKSIVLKKNGEAHYSIHGKNINVEHPDIPKVFKDVDLLLDTISRIDIMKVCQGICTNEFEVDKDCTLSKDDLGFWRHNNCTLITDTLQCDSCYDYNQYLSTIVGNNPVLSDRSIYYYKQVY